MLPRRGLLRHRDSRWFHVSTGQTTAVFRPLDPQQDELRFSRETEQEDLDRMIRGAEIFSIGRIAAELAGILDFPSQGFRHEDREIWRTVADALEEAVTDERGSSVRQTAQGVKIVTPIGPSPAEPGTLVPVSRMRRFYETLRMVNVSAVHSAIAKHLAGDSDRTDVIDTLFSGSLAHLDRYDNRKEAFHPGGRDWFVGYRGRPDQFARCLTARLAPAELERKRMSVAGSELEYQVLDYEVSPLRTTGNQRFEDGRPASSSGAGGMDLLLASDDGLPVIGEIKAPADTSLFLALIQSLTYACEILTPSQGQRLRNVFPGAFKRRASPVCEILIVVAKADSPRLEQETFSIIKRLLGSPKRAVAKRIRRITVAEADLGRDDGARVALRYSEASSYHVSPNPMFMGE